MGGLLESLFGVLDKLLGIAEIKIDRVHLDRMIEIRKDILSEEMKGDASDDAKIENWYKELKIETDAVAQEITLGAIKH